MKVIPLRYGTVFKKAFGDPTVFSRFASDVIERPIEIRDVRQEFSFPEAVGHVKVEYDLFGEDPTHRVIVEVQHIREEDFFDRFLHYHAVSIVEQATSHAQYAAARDVYTLVVLTREPRERHMRFSVAVSDVDPLNELGQRLGVYRHRLVFLNPRLVSDATPPRVRPWLELIADSLDGEVDEQRYADPALQRVVQAAAAASASPDELARIKDEAAWEDTKAGARLDGSFEVLARQSARKLGRALTDDEHDGLQRRLRELGAEGAGDVVVDSAPEALRAWLSTA